MCTITTTVYKCSHPRPGFPKYRSTDTDGEPKLYAIFKQWINDATFKCPQSGTTPVINYHWESIDLAYNRTGQDLWGPQWILVVGIRKRLGEHIRRTVS
jgi:hypothetical protein